MTIGDAIRRFLGAKSGEDCSRRTIETYERALTFLERYADGEGIEIVGEIDAAVAEHFMEYLNNDVPFTPGGRHIIFRTVKTFLGWVEQISTSYTSPMWRRKGPRVEVKPIKGLTMIDLNRLVQVCDGSNKKRDLAILYFLADTGVRARELLSLRIENVDVFDGQVHLEKTKWRKSRTVIMGLKTRKAVKAYLSERDARPTLPLFTSDEGDELSYWGLRQIVSRLADRAGVDTPGLHDFRRLFAVTMHRNGVDDITLARFMGHSSIEVLKRYLAEDEGDLMRVHRSGSPIDNSLKI